jgi:hypothetical protein
MSEEDRSREAQAATPEDPDGSAADRELSQSELDKVSGGMGLPPAEQRSIAHDTTRTS